MPLHANISRQSIVATNTSPKRRRRLWLSASIVVLTAAAVCTSTIWISGGGVTDLLKGWGLLFDSLGRWTGFACGYVMLLQILFMARIPLFEKGLGHDLLTRSHRILGIVSMVLLLCHIIFPVIHRSLTTLGRPWAQIVRLRGIELAIVAAVLLAVVMATSLRKMRRTLPYEKWHLVHLLSYAATGLALPHQFIAGRDLMGHRISSIVWWALWIAAYMATLIWRVITPLVSSWRAKLRVTAVNPDGTSAVRVRIEGNVKSLAIAPGQFLNFRFLGSPGWTRANPFSLCAPPTDTSMEIAVKIVGDGTRRIAQLKPGCPVMIEGPYGSFVGNARQRSQLLMIGAGVGVAPLIGLLSAESWEAGQAILIVRDSDMDEAILSSEIAQLTKTRGLIHIPLRGSRKKGSSTWMPTSVAANGAEYIGDLLNAHGGPESFDVFVCGPAAWGPSLITDLSSAGITKTSIHREAFNI